MSFPGFSSFHAHGQMQTTFAAPCSQVSNTFKTELTNFQDPANGIYKQIKEENNYFWFTRTTPVKHYVDDISFSLADAANGTCALTAKS